MENDQIKKLKESIFPYSVAKSIANRPVTYLVLFFLALAVIAPGARHIKSRWSPRIWFADDHPQIQRLDAFEKQFGSDQFLSLAVHQESGIFAPIPLKVISQLTQELWQVSDIIRVESLSNYNYIESIDDDILIDPFFHEDTSLDPSNLLLMEKKAKADITLQNFFLSQDSTLALIYGYTKPGLSGDPDFEQVVKEVRTLVKKYETKGLHIHLLGGVSANDAFREISEKDTRTLIPFMIFFILLLLYFQYRSIIAMGLAVVLVIFTIGFTFGFMGHFGIVFNSLLSAIPGVLLAICIADAVHILTSYFYYRRNYPSKESLIYSLTKNFKTTLLTSISTAISFFSITRTELVPIHDLGVLCGIGTLLAWLFTYTFLGPTLALLSNFLDKYPIKSVHFSSLFKLKKKSSKNQSKEKNAVAKKAALFIHKFRYSIIIIFLFMTAGSVYIGLKNEVNSDPIKYFHTSVPIRKAYDFSVKKIDGLRGVELVIDSGRPEGIKDPVFLKKLEDYIHWILKDPQISGARSILEILKKMNQVLNGGKASEYKVAKTQKGVAEQLFLYTISLPQGSDINNMFTLDKRSLRIKIGWNIQKSKESEAKVKVLVEKAQTTFNLNAHAGGNAPIYLAMNTLVVESFFSSILMALILVSLLLLFVYRDLYISLISLLPNTVPLCFGAALMQLLDKPIDIGTSIVSTVCLGIAVDDTIHFVGSYKQYRRQGLSPMEAIIETFSITGKALTITTVLLVVGFGCFSFADFVPNRNFGILCSLILALALISDLLFLPALLFVLDKDQTASKESIVSKASS